MTSVQLTNGHFSTHAQSAIPILFAGSLNMDFSVRVPHLPLPGETVLGADYHLTPGGKGANQAVACALSGGLVSLIGVTGRDEHAKVLRASLQQNGVHIQHVHESDAHTGAAFIGVSGQGENFIMVSQGANALLRPEHLPDLTGAAYLVMQLETPIPTVEAFAKAAQASGVAFVLNAAPAQSLSSTLLSCITVLVVNERELVTVCEAQQNHAGSIANSVAAMARELVSRGPKTVVVTLGEQGCMAVTHSGDEIRLPAFNVEVVDTTGAGDTFTGVLTACLAIGDTLSRSLQFASAAAALACTRPGAQASMPTREAIEEFLECCASPSQGDAQ